MNKKNILIAILIITVIAILITGVGVFIAKNVEQRVPNLDIESFPDPLSYIGDCNDKTGIQKEQWSLQRAALTGDIEFCSQTHSNYTQEECYAEIAIAQRNPSICEYSTKNVSKCKELYAINNLDSLQCPPENQMQCKTLVQQWIEKYKIQSYDCEQMTPKVYDAAFSGANNLSKKQQCFEFLANIELEPGYCDNLKSIVSNQNILQQCKNRAQKRDFTFEKCSTRMGYGHFRDVCFYQLAKQEKSSVFCEYIKLDVLKNRCLNN